MYLWAAAKPDQICACSSDTVQVIFWRDVWSNCRGERAIAMRGRYSRVPWYNYRENPRREKWYEISHQTSKVSTNKHGVLIPTRKDTWTRMLTPITMHRQVSKQAILPGVMSWTPEMWRVNRCKGCSADTIDFLLTSCRLMPEIKPSGCALNSWSRWESCKFRFVIMD